MVKMTVLPMLWNQRTLALPEAAQSLARMLRKGPAAATTTAMAAHTSPENGLSRKERR